MLHCGISDDDLASRRLASLIHELQKEGEDTEAEAGIPYVPQQADWLQNIQA